MHLEKYVFQTDEDLNVFKFESCGPKGIIRKIVKYEEMPPWNDLRIFKVSFGDDNEMRGSC